MLDLYPKGINESFMTVLKKANKKGHKGLYAVLIPEGYQLILYDSSQKSQQKIVIKGYMM